jgi:hypothetical protein
MLAMPRLIGWQGGKKILQKKGSSTKKKNSFHFSFFLLEAISKKNFERSSNVVTKSKCVD